MSINYLLLSTLIVTERNVMYGVERDNQVVVKIKNKHKHSFEIYHHINLYSHTIFQKSMLKYLKKLVTTRHI